MTLAGPEAARSPARAKMSINVHVHVSGIYTPFRGTATGMVCRMAAWVPYNNASTLVQQ